MHLISNGFFFCVSRIQLDEVAVYLRSVCDSLTGVPGVTTSSAVRHSSISNWAIASNLSATNYCINSDFRQTDKKCARKTNYNLLMGVFLQGNCQVSLQSENENLLREFPLFLDAIAILYFRRSSLCDGDDGRTTISPIQSLNRSQMAWPSKMYNLFIIRLKHYVV